jgi:hypothetical protein
MEGKSAAVTIQTQEAKGSGLSFRSVRESAMIATIDPDTGPKGGGR